ncbi:M20/M25/M40 family metallo-hydrolase [Microvirga lotononidis]|uniref:Acetylornithine deacetylase/succinyldiaminopimelate desuccinylase-like deacylase n=1 Tax=Microvirga lotononidis TaxID=864069 RepID=I4Z256_9HYPH|nr:M20/M25/M40 family metallo-hydrolase [Microvirga lotononidis]EIM30298.1 acetylornithine deacetylase/succinyldiaminopimelate desuccinylase-like deacylase [Microvirga lotononidis]WQO31143.1 M20/M25/M40 family metallo-hydrolase [Microvirga lotononidis]
MDLSHFPIQPDSILKRLRRWVECESPSWDGAAVSAMAGLAAEDLRQMGATVHTIPGNKGYGDCALAEFGPAGAGPGILVLGHLDTVHERGSLAGPMPWREHEGRCYGPGAYDMKSGICLALEAIERLRREGISPKLPVRVLLTSDEESGSPSTRSLIEQTAREAKYVLVPEGSEPNGNLVSGRFPTTRFQLWTYGKPSHALLQRSAGRSAINAMAALLPRIEALNTPNCSFTVTYVRAGQMVATVPMESYAEIICTARAQDYLDEARALLEKLGSEEGVEIKVDIKARRPTWTPGPADERLWLQARDLARSTGLELNCEMLFGGSDGNFTGALGVPTLDALGPVGADAHQLTENIELSTLVPRGRVMAGLLATLE